MGLRGRGGEVQRERKEERREIERESWEWQKEVFFVVVVVGVPLLSSAAAECCGSWLGESLCVCGRMEHARYARRWLPC